jgi:NitT/TauT family transport system substrate-binding protein
LALLAFAVSAAGATAGPDHANAKPPKLQKIRIQIHPGFTGDIPLYVADKAGFFRKRGLQVQTVLNPLPTAPLLAGDVDIVLYQPTLAVLAQSQNQDLKILMSIQTRITQQLIVQKDLDMQGRKPGAFPGVIRALRGKTIAVTVRGGAIDVNVRYLVSAAGMDPNRDVRIIPTGSVPQQLAALQAGQVDAALLAQPAATIAVTGGTGKSILNLAAGEGPRTLDQVFTVAGTTGGLVRGKPVMLKRFIAAMLDARDYIRNPKNNQKVLALTTKLLEGTSPAILPVLVNELRSTMSTARYTAADLAKAQEVLKVAELLNDDVPSSNVLATGFLNKILATRAKRK